MNNKGTMRSSQVNKLYTELALHLSKIEINNLEDYQRYKDAGSYFVDYENLIEIEVEFSRKLSSLLENHFTNVCGANGLGLIINQKNPNLLPSHRKKIAVFSQSTSIITDPIYSFDVDFLEEHGSTLEYVRGPDVSSCLSYLYKYKKDINIGTITPIPEHIHLMDTDCFDDAVHDAYMKEHGEISLNVFKHQHDPHDEFYREIKIASLIDMDGVIDSAFNAITDFQKIPDNILRLSLDSSLFSKNTDIYKLGLILPSIEKVPLDTVLKLRKDYYLEFRRFQKSLKKLSQDFHGLGDNNKITHILEEVEDEINQINKTFNKIKKWHKSLSIRMGLISLIFYFSVKSPQIASHLHAMFSGLATVTFFEYYRHVKDAKTNIENHPFYFPMLIKDYCDKQ